MSSSAKPSLGLANLAGCPDCGLLQRVPGHLVAGTTVACRRCDAVLHRHQLDPLGRPLALALAALCLYLAAVSLPLLSIDLRGRETSSTLLGLPGGFDRFDHWELTAVTATTVLLLPLLRIAMLAAVLAGLRLRRPPRRLYRLYRWQAKLRPWAMVEVFLLGVFVAYTRLTALADVDVGPALWALGGLMLVMVATDAAQDEHAVWAALEQRGATSGDTPLQGPNVIACDGCGLVSQAADGASCPRCAAQLRLRRPGSVARGWALIIAATILYLPANAYPVMIITTLGRETPHTILGGAEDLVGAGLWPLALLVFCASILVPVLKLLGLGVLLVAARRGASRRLRDLTRLHRLVNAVGRWSMIDVFMLATLVALVQAGLIASIAPGLGAPAFAAVVVLTMLAAEGFDARLIWDAAERRDAA